MQMRVNFVHASAAQVLSSAVRSILTGQWAPVLELWLCILVYAVGVSGWHHTDTCYDGVPGF